MVGSDGRAVVPEAVHQLVATERALDNWTDPDPQPDHLDAALELLGDDAFEYHEGDPAATLKLMVLVEGDDASRLARLAEARQQKPSQVLAELLRNADRPAA